MLKIGEFAQLSSISIHMLRNYDKLGLLVPSHIDSESGYRYYDRSQLMDANQIIALKSMGFHLEEIKSLVGEQQITLHSVLNQKLQEKCLELDRITHQIDLMKTILNTQTNLDDYALSIVQKTIEPMRVVCLSGEISSYDKEGDLWQQLESECKKNKLHLSHQSPAMSIYQGYNDENQNAIVEIQLTLLEEIKVQEPLFIRKYPSREVVSAVFKGGYYQIGMVNSAIAEWLEINHLEICGQSFTIYHNSPENCKDSNSFVTELCFPIIPK